MLDFKSADQQIAGNSPLIKAILDLVELVIEKKKFIFNEAEIDFDIQLLVANNIVIVSSGKVRLQDDYLFYYISYIEFSKKLSFSLTGSLDQLFDFLNEIEANLDSSNVIGRSSLLRGINAIALYYQHCLFQPDLLPWLDTWLGNKDKMLYMFTDAFSRLIPLQKFETVSLLEIIRRLYASLEYDKPNTINASVQQIATGLNSYSSLNIIRANVLLDILISNFDKLNESIAINVLSGLRKTDPSIVSRIKELVKNELYQPFVVVSLSQPFLGLDDNRINLEIVEGIKNENKFYQMQLPAFCSSIINNEALLDNDIITRCFKIQMQLIIKEDIDFPVLVLRSIGNRKNHEKQKLDLVLTLVNQEHFDPKLTPLIPHVFFEFSDFKYYIEFLMVFARSVRFKIDEKIFEHCAFNFRDKQPSAFDTELVNFLIHDQGEIRWMGQQLFNSLSHHRVKFFSCNILELPPKAQFKLFTSLFSMFNEPKDVLSSLLPLIQTSNDFVKESFICRIEMYGEDYGSQVIKVLQTEWPVMTDEQKNIHDRVQAHIQSVSAERNERDKMKELNPLYNHHTYFKSYMEGYRKVFQRGMNAAEKQGIFHQLGANTTILARGGGWKHQATGEISQLSKFSSSYIFPTSYFVSPDNFEWDINLERTKKWDKFLSEWEAIL